MLGVACLGGACSPSSSFHGNVPVYRPQVIPKLPPGAEGTSRWDHICLKGGDNFDDLSSSIAEAGHEGWEMVSFVAGYRGYISCFKRPIVPVAATSK